MCFFCLGAPFPGLLADPVPRRTDERATAALRRRGAGLRPRPGVADPSEPSVRLHALARTVRAWFERCWPRGECRTCRTYLPTPDARAGRDEGGHGARGCGQVCAAKSRQPRPEADQRQTPAAPCVRELGGFEQGEHRPAHAEGYCYVAREAEGALAGEDEYDDAGASAPQRDRPRRQPAVGLRPVESVRGAGRGVVATVTATRARVSATPRAPAFVE